MHAWKVAFMGGVEAARWREMRVKKLSQLGEGEQVIVLEGLGVEMGSWVEMRPSDIV